MDEIGIDSLQKTDAVIELNQKQTFGDEGRENGNRGNGDEAKW